MDARTLLIQSINNGNVNQMRDLLDASPELLNAPLDKANGMSALQLAIKIQNPKLVDELLNRPGVNVNYKNSQGASALRVAVSHNNVHAVRCLLQFDEIDIDSVSGINPPQTLLTQSEHAHYNEISQALYQLMAVRKLNQILALHPPAYMAVIKDEIVCSMLTEKYLTQHAQLIRDAFANEGDEGKFTLYAKTLRKGPSAKLLYRYLDEIHQSLISNQDVANIALTHSEKDQVKARNTWTNIISETDMRNAEIIKSQNIKLKLIERLIKLGYKQNTELVYAAIIDYMKHNSVIVVTFKATSLKNNKVTDYQALNYFERGGNDFANTDSYKKSRANAEDRLFSGLKQSINGKLSTYTRPRYGLLLFPDSHAPIGSRSFYGDSYIVLKEITKFNSLFNVRDSLNGYSAGVRWNACSYHHLEYLLAQSSDTRLNALAERVTTGKLLNYHGNYEEYIEVMLPAIDYLNPSMVQHIHISSSEYAMTPDDASVITGLGITLTNHEHSVYPPLNSAFQKAISNNDIAVVMRLLESHPVLAITLDHKGNQPIHLAAEKGNIDLVKCLHKHGANIFALNRQFKSVLSCAVQTNNYLFIRQLIEAFPELLKGDNQSGFTPLMSAVTMSDDMFALMLDVSNQQAICHVDSNGQSALIIAAQHGLSQRALALVSRPGKSVAENSEVLLSSLNCVFQQATCAYSSKRIAKISVLSDFIVLSDKLVKLNDMSLRQKFDILIGYLLEKIETANELHHNQKIKWKTDSAFSTCLRNAINQMMVIYSLIEPAIVDAAHQSFTGAYEQHKLTENRLSVDSFFMMDIKD